MTSYNVGQLGSTLAAGVFQGQYWRFVTSMFGHHDAIHIAFNLYALTVIGPLVEELYDRKKMMLVYFVTGVSSMMISFVFHVEWLGATAFSSIGASGAACGLMGACLAGSIRLGPEGRNVKGVMLRWGIYMIVWGAVVDGIDNAAHFGGFLTGAAMAYVMPLGDTKTVVGHKLLSLVTMSFIALVVGCTALMVLNLRGYPVSLDKDAGGRNLFLFEIEKGTEPEYSSQAQLFQACAMRIKTADFTEEARRDCELAARAVPHASVLYRALAHMEEREGNKKRAARLRYTALRLERRL
jgi:membrane associated rhomboid family serine protease